MACPPVYERTSVDQSVRMVAYRPKAASGELGGKRPTHLKVEHIRGRQLTVYDDVRRFAQARCKSPISRNTIGVVFKSVILQILMLS
jgi:hypothetical protein